MFILAALMILFGFITYSFGSTTSFVNSPTGSIVYDSTNGDLYATSSNGILVINGTTNSVIKTISLPAGYFLGGQGDIVFDPQNGDLYAVSGSRQASNPVIEIVDTRSNTLIGNISLSYDPTGPTFDPSNGELYFGANFALYAINTSTNLIQNVTIKPVCNNQGCGTIDLNSVNIAYDPKSNDLYLGVHSFVDVINSTNNVVAQINTGGYSIGMIYDSVNGYMYMTDISSSYIPSEHVLIINATSNALVSTMNLTTTANRGLTYDTVNGNVLVTEAVNSSLILDGKTNAIIARLSPYTSAAFDSANADYYATTDNGISIINGSSNKVVGTISLVQVIPANNYLVVIPFALGVVLIGSGFLVGRKNKIGEPQSA